MTTFKSHRAYLNSRLHALSSRIAGNDSVLRSSLAELEVKSCTELTDNQARNLVAALEKYDADLNKGVQRLTNQPGIEAWSPSSRRRIEETETRSSSAKRIEMTLAQRNTIIKLSKYILGWSIEALFSFIVNNIMGLREQMSTWEIKHSRIRNLYKLLTRDDADFIIKKLDAIKERDEMWLWIFANILTPLRTNIILFKIKVLRSSSPSGSADGVEKAAWKK